MVVNSVHIGIYFLVAAAGLLIGQFIQWMNIRMPEYKKIFTIEMFKKAEPSFKANYILMIVNALIYVGLLYKYGLSLEFLKYAILTTCLISTFIIDYKLQIIPNRLNLTMFEIGLVFAFIYGCTSVNMALDSLYGMLIGGGIFLIITLIGGLIAGKEAMGFGDVKLMGALGLYFGAINIVVVAVLSFLIGAVLSIALMIAKRKSGGEYIPFGPFIVISSAIVMFVPSTVMIHALLKVFSLGLYGG